ncbi:hypothetical protein Tco_0543794 [Tanacetum coccineum]
MDYQTLSTPPIAYNSPQSSTKPMTEFPQMDSGLDVHVFNQGDDLISCLNKAMDFLTAIASLSYKGNATSSGGNNVGGQARVVKCYTCQDSDCDDVSNAKVVLMVNLSNDGLDIISEEKLALKQQINSLERNLSNQIKEKESLLQTFIVFKNESKERESKYLDNENDLEKKIKEFDNIVYKVGQSAQTKAQRIKPTLYDGSVISSQHVASPVIDDEETLILEEAPKELPKVSLVNTSLKKLKYHLGQFDTVVKKRIMPDAITEEEWGTRALSKEHCDSLVSQLNSKSMENMDLKGEHVLDNATTITSAIFIAPGMFKLDIEPLSL